MKKILSLFLFVTLTLALRAQMPAFSDSAEFYLLTCEPGTISYERFGHTGIRIVERDIDVTVNWGVFSFEEPNFIGRFVIGQTDYMIDMCPTDIFLKEYKERGSIVYQNHLNLSRRDKRELLERLTENFKPENRTYRYNFIFDNCATRAYQIIIQSADSAVCDIVDSECGTYREMVNSYAKPDTWLSLGINIVFGADADQPVLYQNSTTFPLEAMEVLSYTTNLVDSVRQPILDEPEVLFNADRAFNKKDVNDFLVFLLFALPVTLMALFVLMYFKNRKHYWFAPTQIVLWLSGLLGLLILFLEIFSTHPLVRHNMNVLWCNPLNIIFAILLCLKGFRRLKGIVSILMSLFTLVYLGIITVQVQGSTPPVIGCVILVLGVQIMIFATYRLTLREMFVHRERKVGHHHHHHHHHAD